METKLKEREKTNIIAIKELKGLQFYVEDYQRGYKWGAKQVTELLDDINSFKKEDQAFYCLQPIVVKEREKNKFELIDGQQRLTTTYIILQCLGITLFNLDYKTRKQSEEFLNKVKNLAVVDLNKTKLNIAWGDYVAESPKEYDNVDNYHFFCSYQIITNWLQALNFSEKETFTKNLCTYTKVIWYNIKSELSPEEIFINFNQGKIHLEQAELIKALFVLYLKTEPNLEIRAFKTNQFAEEWNTIENQLQDDSFWYFVSNDTSDKRKANRIDLLFDIVKKKPKKEQSNLFAYHKYLHQLNTETLKNKDWQEVKNLFNLLLEWFQNRTMYHYLGLLIHLEIKSISEVYQDYLEHEDIKDKLDFEKQIKLWIADKINISNPDSKYNLSNLVYQTPKQTHTILVIHNVATYHTSDTNYRFPFDKLKTQKWSLEHIHAQKSEEFKKVLEIQNWISDIKLLLNDANSTFDLEEQLNILEEEILKHKPDDIIPKSIKRRINELSNLLDKKLDTHSIKNLCLLDNTTNSSLSNSNFQDKRKSILQIDMQGGIVKSNGKKQKTFIPICTKNVFLKYYTKNTNAINFTFWGYEDRKDYEEALEQNITNFLNLSND
ncbi:DUF262 domain-containing protein [Tenacibaculum geojense]|uniref:DUF262 domain-containing protein n=1 Tax=Tenacibaculum geojense TaxID=915352 RepID=A0ABW3JRP8_9FLAO